MVSATTIALTGLNAASVKTSVAANNIANSKSTSSESGSGPYMPKDVVQVSQALGGTKTSVVESGKEPIKLYDPKNIDSNNEGFVEYPNVDISEELVKQSEAVFQYKSNLNIIQKERETSQFLLDVFA